MLELRVMQPRLLKEVVKAIKGLVTNVNFDCSTAGISLQAMNSSKVAMVALFVGSDDFVHCHYRCEQHISLGINLDDMDEVLRLASDGDDAILIGADDSSRTVRFTIERPPGDRIYREMELINIDSEDVDLLEEYQATFKMPAPEFARVCKNLIDFGGDNVEISVGTSEVKFCTRSDIGTANISYRNNTAAAAADHSVEHAVIIEMWNPGQVKQTFALRYLKAFTEATPLAAQVTFRMSPDCHILVDYMIRDTVGGHLRFYLSPKVEETG